MQRSLLVFTAPLVASLALTGCFVPQSKYDASVAKFKAEHEEHLKAEGELARVREDIARIDEMLRKKEQTLTEQEGKLAETKLEVDRENTERQEAASLVEQLRGELGRVGDHLRDYSNQKQQLEAALTDAETRNKNLERQEATVRDKVLVTRDLSYGLAEFVIDDKAIVTAVNGKPAVRLDAKTAFDKKGELSAETKTMLERIARAASPRSAIRVAITERTEELTDQKAKPDERTARLTRVYGALSAGGLPKDRIDVGTVSAPGDATVYPTPTPPGTPAPEAKPAAPAPAPAAKTKPARWQDGPGSLELTFDVPPPITETKKLSAAD